MANKKIVQLPLGAPAPADLIPFHSIGNNDTEATTVADLLKQSGSGNTVSGTGAFSTGTANNVTGDDSISVGNNNFVPGDHAMAVGSYGAAIRHGEVAYANGPSQGSVGGAGSAQAGGPLVFSGGIPGVGLSETVVLKTNGGADDWVVEASKSYLVELRLLAREAAVGVGNAKLFSTVRTFLAEANSNLSSIAAGSFGVDVTFGSNANLDTCSIQPSVVPATGFLFTFTGPSGVAVKLDIVMSLTWIEILSN